MRLPFLLLLFLCTPPWLYAEPDAKAKEEIDHLLDFIKKSDVTFIRNGKEYPVEDGLKHIQKKYDHFKDKIKTAEDFIEKSATKSEMSGENYQIKNKDNSKQETAKWLMEELKKYRENQVKTEQQK